MALLQDSVSETAHNAKETVTEKAAEVEVRLKKCCNACCSIS